MGTHGHVGATSEAAKAIDWNDVYKRLVVHGLKALGLAVEDAKQVAQEALRRYFDPQYANWEPTKYPTLLLFLGSTMNGIASDIRQRKGYLGERPTRDGVLPDIVTPAASPEDRVVAANFARVAVGKLLERASADELVQNIVLKMVEGIDTAAEQAVALGVNVKEIYNARERLKIHVASVKAEMEES